MAGTENKEIQTSPCAEGEVCILADSVDRTNVGSCLGQEGVVNGTSTNGDSCTEDAASYWGTCTSANFCTDFYGSGSSDCVGLCDISNLDVCANNQVCLFGLLSSSEDIGLCAGQCNIFTNEGCDEGNSCLFANVGESAERVEQAWGYCSPRPDAPEVLTNEVCEANMETGVSNCPSGHLCAQTTQNGPPVCIQLCQDDNDEATCAEGTSCQKVFGDEIQTVGACL